MKESCPRQPGDMIRVTHARINVSTEITNRGGWLNWNTTDDDRVEGASSQAASRAQPDELRFRSIQLEAVAGHPLAHDLDAVSETDGELSCITGKAVIIELQVVCVPVDEKPQLLGNMKNGRCIQDEEQGAENGTRPEELRTGQLLLRTLTHCI